jgi:ATP-binding cassette subfamily B protein
MENMLDLFKEEQEVKDDPKATALEVKNGNVEFQNVSFGYVPERTVLANISFTIPAGKTVALVSASSNPSQHTKSSKLWTVETA